MELEKQNPLWTKDFTIITLGSIVSMIGNAVSGFTMSLLVLDYTQSSFLYSLYIIIFTLPQIIMPIFSGALLDRFSRKKTIYTLDFISSFLYLAMGLLLFSGWFSFPVFALFVFVVGSIQAIYQVAYSSFYPLLITEGNFSKAYSVTSMLESFIFFVMPIANFLYNKVGIAPILTGNFIFFFIAAVMETTIEKEEDYVQQQKETEVGVSKVRQMFLDTKEGFSYLWAEKGLFFIAVYFGFSAMGGGVSQVVGLPYMKETYANGVFYYSLLGLFSVSGRSLMAFVYYRKKIPPQMKFTIALCVYFSISILEGFQFFVPLPFLFLMLFVSGMGGVTSWNIRLSATQSYVPDAKKGRFNGAFNMISTVGSLLGEGIAGVLSFWFPLRNILLGVMLVNGLASLILIGGHKKEIAPIYNTVN